MVNRTLFSAIIWVDLCVSIYALCPEIHIPSEHGYVQYSPEGRQPNTTAYIECHKGMILIGSEEIECELNSTWSPAPGTCISGHEDVLMIPDLEMTREVDIAALRWMSRYGSVQDDETDWSQETFNPRQLSLVMAAVVIVMAIIFGGGGYFITKTRCGFDDEYQNN